MIEELIKRANAGDGEAMLRLAMAYSGQKSLGSSNEEEEIEWYKERFTDLTNIEISMRELEDLEINYGEAIKWYEDAYKHGEPVAYSLLALLYQDGRGVEQDIEKAEYYYKEATKGDEQNPITYLALGNYYEFIQDDLNSALEAYRGSVNAGNVYDSDAVGRVLYKLAYRVMDELPEQAQVLFEEGLSAYEQAAELDNPAAMLDLGHTYRQGMGVEEDVTVALDWYKQASELGNTDAMILLGTFFSTGESGQEELDLAKDYFQLAANLGDPSGLYCLSEWYSLINNVEYDLGKSVNFMLEAMENSDDDYFPYLARLNTANPLLSPAEEEKLIADRGEINIESPSFYEERSEQGDSVAMFRLAGAYRDGRGVEQDGERAVYWYEKTLEQGNLGANLPLAVLYYEGNLVEKDYDKAFEYLVNSASYNDAAAMYNLGVLHHTTADYDGHNLDIAQQWYKLASEYGHVNAKYQVGNIYLSEHAEQEQDQDKDQGQDQEQDQELKELGMAWMYDAAIHGHSDALFIVGNELAYGDIFGHDPELAIQFLHRAQQKGIREAAAVIEQIEKDFDL